jgi:hypothetical protein
MQRATWQLLISLSHSHLSEWFIFNRRLPPRSRSSHPRPQSDTTTSFHSPRYCPYRTPSSACEPSASHAQYNNHNLPYLSSFQFSFWLRIVCIRNAAPPAGSVLPRSLTPSRPGRPRGARAPQRIHQKQSTRVLPRGTPTCCTSQLIQRPPAITSPSSRTDLQQST